VVEAINFLRSVDLLNCFELLHFHLGSQISAIRAVKNALREAGRFYVEVAKLGAPLKYFDAGGGLGVDYDGSQTNFASSMNYTTQEYANDIVFSLQEICDAGGVPHPTIVTESGRAVVAHHSMLVVDILGVGEFDVGKAPDKIPRDATRVVKNLFETYKEVSRKNVLESYHDALEYKEEALQLFNLGNLTLSERVVAEDVFWAICQKLLKIVREMREVPEELEGLERALSDTYFCNFSMFQSLPDIWAIDQLFPIMPIHRLGEEPTRRAVLADITCDSDGKIDHFIDRRDVKSVLELHPVNGQDYYLGIFLIGAYQEILGDLHNLFGNTNTVHVSMAQGGGYQIEHVVTGDTVTDVLKYVSYSREDMVARVRRFAELAVRANRMSLEETRSMLRMYEEGLAGYTYLERS
jgi:arginine decarboxylase